MTPAEREEGRRLLSRLREAFGDDYHRALADWHIWCRQHADSFLAEPPDPETIARAVVREFADSVVAAFEREAQTCDELALNSHDFGCEEAYAIHRSESKHWRCSAEFVGQLKRSKEIDEELARERGVELNTNQPQAGN